MLQCLSKRLSIAENNCRLSGGFPTSWSIEGLIFSSLIPSLLGLLCSCGCSTSKSSNIVSSKINRHHIWTQRLRSEENWDPRKWHAACRDHAVLRSPQGESVPKGILWYTVRLTHVAYGSKYEYDSAANLITNYDQKQGGPQRGKFSTVVGCNFSGIEIRVVADQNAACCVMPGICGWGYVQRTFGCNLENPLKWTKWTLINIFVSCIATRIYRNWTVPSLSLHVIECCCDQEHFGTTLLVTEL